MGARVARASGFKCSPSTNPRSDCLAPDVTVRVGAGQSPYGLVLTGGRFRLFRQVRLF
jgi:hypothetical protein